MVVIWYTVECESIVGKNYTDCRQVVARTNGHHRARKISKGILGVSLAPNSTLARTRLTELVTTE